MEVHLRCIGVSRRGPAQRTLRRATHKAELQRIPVRVGPVNVMLTGVSSDVDIDRLGAVGASFAAVIVIEIVPVALSIPSVTRNRKESDPLKFGFGV